MFDVLVYLYENYWRPDACPDPRQLTRKLVAVGFESEEIQDALDWLAGLTDSSSQVDAPQSETALRVYTPREHDVLGGESIGFISFLESAGVLPPAMREMVLLGAFFFLACPPPAARAVAAESRAPVPVTRQAAADAATAFRSSVAASTAGVSRNWFRRIATRTSGFRGGSSWDHVRSLTNWTWIATSRSPQRRRSRNPLISVELT